MAAVVALLLAALLAPATEWLKRVGVPASLAALSGVLGLLAGVGAAGYLVGKRVAGQFGDLREQLTEGLQRLRRSLTGAVPGLSGRRLDELTAEASRGIRAALPAPIAGATSAAEIVGAALLAVILLFFALREGPAMWCWLVDRLPETTRDGVDRAGRAGWHTLSSYTHVQQAEGHLLHPLVMRRAVRLHPVVTLLAFGVGSLVAGIAGALIAVPLCAFTYHAAVAYRKRADPLWPQPRTRFPIRLRYPTMPTSSDAGGERRSVSSVCLAWRSGQIKRFECAARRRWRWSW